MRISRKLFSFGLINTHISCFVRKMSVKCSETVVINLRIIRNTSANIRLIIPTLHFHHSNCFSIVCDSWIYLYREQSEKIFRQVGPGPAIIKLFESENELKCKNHLHDFIETLCLFSKIWENYLRHFTISLCRYNYLAKFISCSWNSYGKILEKILKFYGGGPGALAYRTKADCCVTDFHVIFSALNQNRPLGRLASPGHHEQFAHHPGAFPDELLHQLRPRHADEGALCVVRHGTRQQRLPCTRRPIQQHSLNITS